MDEPAIVVGQVMKAHGVRGEVSLRNRSDNPGRWVPGATVFTPDGDVLTIASVRPHGERLLVTFEGIADRTSADALRGVELTVPVSWLPALPDGEWWPHELEGCAVRTESGRELGIVSEVVLNPANDLWVTVDEQGNETMVPALRSLLVDVDLASRSILVKDVPGLTAPDADD